MTIFKFWEALEGLDNPYSERIDDFCKQNAGARAYVYGTKNPFCALQRLQ